MKVIHILCLVLMIAMMQHTCLADEQIEITYGDGWTHYNYTDGTQAHKLAPTNYLRWDGEWRPGTEMNFLSGDWPYTVEEFDTYYFITRFDDSLILPKNYRTYDFQPYKIGVHLTLTPMQLNQMSTYHSVGGVDYWYITIPQSLKETAKHLNWDNKLPNISNETGYTLNQSDDVLGEWLPNYKYQNVGGELRLYYNQVTRSFGVVSDKVIFDFNSYVINSTTGWQNTNYNNTTEDLGDHYNKIGIFADNFDDGDEDWIEWGAVSDAETTIVNGKLLIQEDTTASSYIKGVYYSGNDISDFTLLFNGNILSTDYMFIHYRFADFTPTTSDGYVWFLDNDDPTDTVSHFRLVSDGSGSSFGSEPTITTDLADDTEYAYRLKINGSTFSGYVNNILEHTESNSTYTTGKIGFSPYQNANDIKIDDVRILSLDSNGNEILQGEVTHWHDAGAGYQTASFIVNMTTPTNTNYTVWYADNGSSFTQIGGTYTGNQTLSITGTKYKNTDLRIVMNGNITITPEEIEVTFVTEASAAGAVPTPASTPSVSSGQYDELDLPLILYILTISMLYLLIAFRHGVAAVELSLIYLIFAFFFLLFQTITISVNYIYLTLFLLLFLISIAGITKQGVD